MFELVVLACLTGELSDTCAERVLPSPIPASQATCEADADARADAWFDARPSLRQKGHACKSLADAGTPLTLIEIAPGIYVHEGGIGVPNASNKGDLANLSVVIGEDSVAVIDAGGTRAVAEGLYLAIRAITDNPIKMLILTHMHPDHALGADVFAEAGASIVGHAKLDRGLRARAANYEAALHNLIGPEGFLGTRAAFPTVEAMDDATIDLGGRTLRLREWPTAHTDNDVTVLDEATGTLFAGDLVFAEHTPALDGSLIGWMKVLDSFDDGIERVVPGHGPPSIPWPSGGKANRDYLNVLAKDARAAILKGESIGTAVKHIGESERDKWQLFDEFNIRNATAAYKELEWE